MKKPKNNCCSADRTKEKVKEHYGSLITGKRSSCCGPSGIEEPMKGKMAQLAGYGEEERSQVPEEAYQSSFGCGNPLAYADVTSGQVVLDLGSGAGLDVLLASRKVGPKGRVIGLDMTLEMIAKGRENAVKAGVTNVEFRWGEMENMPVEDESVDWIISNCVINLSPDKKKVFQEAFRVLKPEGKMLISDIVAEGIPEEMKDYLWFSCIGGALDERSYLRMIQEAGFEKVQIVDRIDYDRETIKGFLDSSCMEPVPELRDMLKQLKNRWNGKIASIKVSAKKSLCLSND